MIRGVRIVVCVAALLVTASCGKDSFGPSEATEGLAPLVERVRSSAEAGDVDAARQAIAELRASVDGLRRDDRLGDDEAGRLLAAAQEVEQQLSLVTTTTTTTAPPPPPAPKEEPKRDRDKKDDDD